MQSNKLIIMAITMKKIIKFFIFKIVFDIS